MSRANCLDQPSLVSGLEATGRFLRPDFPFTARSQRNENYILFHAGERALSEIIEAFYPYKGNIIYTNGDYRVYAHRYQNGEEEVVANQ
jgi:hypothetical protein